MPALPLGSLKLKEREVQLWHFELQEGPDGLEACRALLSPQERERSQRFRFEKDSRAYMAARAKLRRILAAYVDQAPEALSFLLGAHGKPSLKESPDLCFNLSHSQGWGLCAVAWKSAVGVDLEAVDNGLPFMELAYSYFSAYEYSLLRLAPEEQRRGLFTRLWTHKEAFLKAKGEGLALPLNQFEVHFQGDGSAQVLEFGSMPSPWLLYEIGVGNGFRAALATEFINPNIQLNFLSLTKEP